MVCTDPSSRSAVDDIPVTPLYWHPAKHVRSVCLSVCLSLSKGWWVGNFLILYLKLMLMLLIAEFKSNAVAVRQLLF